MNEFYNRLSLTRRQRWCLGPYKELRTKRGQCPLTATDPWSRQLSFDQRLAIIRAADNAPGHDKKIRAQLLFVARDSAAGDPRSGEAAAMTVTTAPAGCRQQRMKGPKP